MSILIILVFFLFIFLFFVALEAILSLLDHFIFGLILPFIVLFLFALISFVTFNRTFLFLMSSLIPFGILMIEYGIIRLIKSNKDISKKSRPSSEEARMKISDL